MSEQPPTPMSKHDLSNPVVLRRRGFFWYISLADASVTYSYGPGDGSKLPPGRTRSRTFPTVADATTWATDAIDDKLSDGYVPAAEYDPVAEAAAAEAANEQKRIKSEASADSTNGAKNADCTSTDAPDADSAKNPSDGPALRRSSRRRAPPPAPVPAPAPPASRTKRKTAGAAAAGAADDQSKDPKRVKRGHAGTAPVDTSRALGVIDAAANVPGGEIYSSSVPAADGSTSSHVHDAMLALVDVVKRHDKFIVLQLIDDVTSDRFVLFERWGRTGTAGQSLRLEFPRAQLDVARRKFEAKFVQKTGLEWLARDSEAPVSGKYRFVRQDFDAKNAIAIAQGQWQYWVDDGVDGKPTGWYDYDATGNTLTEQLLLEFQSNPWLHQRIVQSGAYAYLVNLQTLTQTNVVHPSHTSRFIRRVAPGETPSPTPPAAVIAAAQQMAAVNVHAMTAMQTKTPQGPVALAAKPAKIEPAPVVNNAQSQPSNSAAPKGGTTGGVAKTEPDEKKDEAPAKPELHIPVDEMCPDPDQYRVVEDYDAMLNQTNIMDGNNSNKYYKLQLLEAAKAKTFHVWTRWGRVGESRGVQTKLMGPFNEIEQAAKAFNKKFRDKSGNSWADRASFKAVSGKYELIEIDHTAKKEDKEEPLVMKLKCGNDDVETLPSKLAPETRDLVELLFEKDMYTDALREFDIDVRKMPLGQLSSEQIEKGVAVLQEIKNELAGASSQQTLSSLSSRFYTALPHDFGRAKPPVIGSQDMLQRCFDMCNVLTDMEKANALMEEAESDLVKQKDRKKVPHPADAQYDSLHADLQLVAEDSEEYANVKAAYEETKGNYDSELLHVWRVDREGERERYDKLGIDNDTLLWHGTHIGTISAILSTGLRIMPHSGGRVGKGIYLASENEKSQGYTTAAANKKVACMFLAQAALGKVHEIREDDSSLVKAPSGFDSVRACGRQAPSAYKTVKLDEKPVRIAVQKAEPQAENATSSFHQDEYLVYKEAQARLRYVISLRKQW